MQTQWLAPLALALQCGIALAQVPADFYREDAESFLGGTTSAGASRVSNFTPHTGAVSTVFTSGGSSGRATETVTFDSYPAPYVRVSADAWTAPGGQGGISFSAIQAQVQYGFTVSGPIDALVPVRFRGRYAINNDSWFTYTNANVAFTTSGMDFTRPDQVGLFAQCDGSSIGYRCYADPSGYPSVNSSIQSTMKTLGFETEFWGVAISGTFEGVLMAPTDASGLARAGVGLSVFASANGVRDNGRSGVSWAFIDPELSIDPGYLALFPESKLLLTPGVGNQMVPVPEASTLAMMFAGLGLLGCVAVGRRRTRLDTPSSSSVGTNPPTTHRASGRYPGPAGLPIVRQRFAVLAKRAPTLCDGDRSMPTIQPATPRVIPWALGIGLGLLLSACGGGDDDAVSTVVTEPPVVPAAPLVGSATGVLTDAAVQGVAYSTSTGVTGTTDALGQFSYNPGDTINFQLGALALGSVPASGLVTPLALASGSADRLQNLLVLLQSLDGDGDASNGITISPASAAAVSASVDLAQAAAAFASVANSGLTAAMAAGGIGRAITSTDQATAHFLDQAKALLSSQVWVGSFDNGAYAVVQRFGPGGELLHADFGAAGDGGMSGLEYGTALATAVDGRGFELSPVLEIDTNGRWGLSHLSACERVSVAGGQLHYLEAPASCVTSNSVPLTPADNDPNGIVGVWTFGSATLVKAQTFVFWANGKYAMLDPIGDDAENSCGGPGVEYGTYSYDAASKQVKVLSVAVDTNGCAGLNDATPGGSGMARFQLTLSSDGKTGTAVFSDATDQVFRVSR